MIPTYNQKLFYILCNPLKGGCGAAYIGPTGWEEYSNERPKTCDVCAKKKLLEEHPYADILMDEDEDREMGWTETHVEDEDRDIDTY